MGRHGGELSGSLVKTNKKKIIIPPARRDIFLPQKKQAHENNGTIFFVV
jgi:hypothetical protein